MRVIKRNGTSEDVSFDKILNRVKNRAKDLDVDPVIIAQKVIAGLYDKATTRDTDRLLIETAAAMAPQHPDYDKLAAALAASALHKETSDDFVDIWKTLYELGVLSDDFMETVDLLGDSLKSIIDYERDFNFSYFGFKTLESRYLLGIIDRTKRRKLSDGSWSAERKLLERPQTLFLRVAVSVCGSDLDEVKKLYDYLSLGYYTHATPTLFNAGTTRPQMSSCFLIAMKDDSLEGIYDTDKECAMISKNSGGVGLWVHNVRADGSVIKSSQRFGDGLIPMLRHVNATFRYVNQGGKRRGSAAIYLEPWHADIEDFIDIRKTTGDDERRCHDLFPAMWVPDLFMKRLEKNEDWTLFSPDEAPGLHEVWGQKFEELYERYEREGRGRKTVKAAELMRRIAVSQKETGTPYMLYKDHANRKSNQQNLGTIKSSNLCTEIIEYSSPEETAVCNLASICLPKFVKNGKYDLESLRRIAYDVTINLNRVIDKNYYPTPATEVSNDKHRPIGIGVQGLADVFMMMRIPYDSSEARRLNSNIFETIYVGAMKASIDLAERDGPYESFQGSPLSKGLFQFDLWKDEREVELIWAPEWENLRSRVLVHGARNSLLLAPMPTASTSQIFDNYEAFEIHTSNLYKRETLAGEFVVVNKHLVKHLKELNLWDRKMVDKIIANNGSVQSISEIPHDVKAIYKTVWETSQKVVIDMAADRGVFICQSQSMNIHMANPTLDQIASLHIYAWKKGLKTGMYYLRTKAAKESVKVTVQEQKANDVTACSIDNPEDCVVCSS
jgi:ribonucleoside-diphosphate reductase alpha chain